MISLHWEEINLKNLKNMIEINKNYNESNLETMAKMPDNFIDLTVTSPPYDNLSSCKIRSIASDDETAHVNEDSLHYWFICCVAAGMYEKDEAVEVANIVKVNF